MNIIFKYVLTNVGERKMRTMVMLLSIALSTALLLVSLSVGASYESAQRKMARGMAGSAALTVSAETGFVDPGVIPNVSSASATVCVLRTTALYQDRGYYETVDLVAADLDQLNEINPPRLADGSPISHFSGSQVILPERFTSKYGIEKGDTVSLIIDGDAVDFQVAQVAAYDTVFLRHTRGATALLPLRTLAEILGSGDGYSEILIAPAQGVSNHDLLAELTAALPEGVRATELVNETQIAADARQKSMPFFLISFFSLTMSVFIIFSSYQVIALDRLPVIGTFRSIGARTRDVTRILLYESALYGVAGGCAGIPAGILALRLILQGMGQSLSQGIEIPVVIPAVGMVLAFTVAVMVSLMSAWIPVRKASRLPLKEMVLGAAVERRCSGRWMTGLGLALVAMATGLPRLVPVELLYPAGGLSLLGFIVAAILMIPLLTNQIARGIEHVYGRTVGNVGRLAARNMRDNRNVTQNITLLFISISAVIAISAVGSFVTTYISDVFRDAELEGFADGHMEPEFVEKVRGMEGIETVLPLYVYENQIQGNGVTFSRLEGTEDLRSYNSMLALNYSERGMEEQAEEAFAAGRAMILSESCLERTGFSVGDVLTLTAGDRPYEYLVVGSFRSRATDVEAVIPSSFAVTDFDADDFAFLAYTATDPEAVMVQIRNLFGDTANWSRTVEEFNSDALSTVGAFLKPMHSMTYFILLLAVVGVVNHLLINHIQRRRIIAVYKSVGLSDRQNVEMTMIEGFSSGLIASLMAMAVSYLEIQTIFLVAGPKISMSPELDLVLFLKAGVLGIIVTVAGSLVPIFKSHRLRLIEEIKFE